MLPTDIFILAMLCYQQIQLNMLETGLHYVFTIRLIDKVIFRLAMGQKLMDASVCPFFIEGPH